MPRDLLIFKKIAARSWTGLFFFLFCPNQPQPCYYHGKDVIRVYRQCHSASNQEQRDRRQGIGLTNWPVSFNAIWANRATWVPRSVSVMLRGKRAKTSKPN